MDPEEKKNKQIRHSNSITGSRHELSAVQLDIYFMLLSKLKADHGNRYEMSVKEIQALTGREWQHDQLKAATLDMIGKVFEIQEKDGLLQVAMLSSAKYLTGTSKIQLTIAEELKPYLFDLKNNFTSFQLQSVLSMNSKYAKWIYILLSRWKDIGIQKFKLEELRYILNIKDRKNKFPEQYKQWGQFKANVLEPAMEKINKSTDLEVSYTTETSGSGKKITDITFFIKVRRSFQPIIPFPIDANQTDHTEINRLKERLQEINIVDPKLVQRIISSPEMRIKANKTLYEMKFNKTIKTPGGYFIKIMGL